MPCYGNGSDHCCWVKGKPCALLIENYTDETGYFRRWACSLRAELGNWDAVLADPRYPTGSWAEGVNCRDWPDGRGNNGIPCSICGAGS